MVVEVICTFNVDVDINLLEQGIYIVDHTMAFDYLSIHLSKTMYLMYPSGFCLYLYIYLSYLSIYRSISIYLSMYISIYLSIYLLI